MIALPSLSQRHSQLNCMARDETTCVSSRSAWAHARRCRTRPLLTCWSRCPLLGEPLRGLLAVDASLRLSAADLESLLPKVIGC